MDGDYYPTEPLAGVDSNVHPDLATLPPVRRTVDIDGLTTHEPAAKVVRVVRAGQKPEGSDTQAPESEQASSSSQPNAPFGIVGGIQERTVRSHDKPIRERPQSTFKSSSTPPASSKASAGDQWYDTDGKPISVFRKRRLIQQGITQSPHLGQRAQSPPSSRDNPVAQKPSPLEGVREKIPAGFKPEVGRDPTRDPHGGAPPEAILQAMQDSMDDGRRRPRKDAVQQTPAFGALKPSTSDESLRQSVSDDNDRMMANMSQADIQEFLESVRGVVGSNTLQKFASRRSRTGAKGSVTPPKVPEGKGKAPLKELDPSSAEEPTQPPSAAQTPPAPTPKETPSKSVRFSEEPPAEHDRNIPALETHHSGVSSAGPDEPQFNRHGAAVTAAFAAGRDESTDDNDVYAIDDLLLLCRSSSAPQRRLFLTLTAQVLRLHGKVVPSTVVTEKKQKNAPSTSEVCNLLIAKEAAVRAALVAGWQVGDNAASVRAAALDLLSAAVEVLPDHLEARAQQPDVPKAGRITNPNEAAAALQGLGAVHKLGANVRTYSNPDQMFSVLSFLSRWSAAAAHAVAASPASPAALTAAADLSGEHNQATPLALLDALVCSSANVAQGLLEAKPLGLQDVLLRLLATVDASSIASDENEQDRALAAVKILYHLSLYGMATDLAHLLWDSLSNILVQLTAQPATAPTLLQHTLRLLTSWTITSTDPHLTAGGHDVHFYTVREWPSFSLDVTRMTKDQDVSDVVLAAACAHVSAALKGVQQYAQTPLSAVASPRPNDREILLQTLNSLTSRALDEFKTLPKARSFADVAQTLDTTTSILSLAAQIESLSESAVIQAQDLGQNLLEAKESWEVMSTTPTWLDTSSPDSLSPRIAVARYVAQLSLLATKGKARVTQRQLVLKLMSLLRPARGEEQVAQHLACSLLDGQPILAPFYRTAFQPALLPIELAIKEADSPTLAGPSTHSTVFGVSEPQDLKAYQTRGSVIFHTPRGKKKLELPPELRPDPTEEQEQEENDDLDPATGNLFWRSPVNGLPVRRDWPLLPLDDLLHSANSAVFNRPGSLPSDWDFTEKQIVFATLALTADLFASRVTPVDGSAQQYLPSSAELWLGLIKVYLLESQGTAPIGDKATGLVTGRDLFADPGIASMMRKVADRAVVSEQQGGTNQETLEQVAPRQGIASFFQMYTDLLGVWDAQSLGDPTFARTVLQATKMSYPSEYRLLFWRDYGHLLPTVPTTKEDVDFQAFVQPYETDLAVLTHLAAALLRGQVKPSQSLLWQIAVTHLAAFVFGSEPFTGRAQLTRMLFGPVGPEHVAHVQHSLLQWTDSPNQESADEATINERRKAVSSTV